ncbi:hypothetical protein [Mobiluncus mulieris]|uniref:hypothetical protein n=1 Tax=Mobiluncus mulieris TaxID=2052 RepID=UPI002093F6D9|nr:hypothetical protein [Mobiluncus mulieris]
MFPQIHAVITRTSAFGILAFVTLVPVPGCLRLLPGIQPMFPQIHAVITRTSAFGFSLLSRSVPVPGCLRLLPRGYSLCFRFRVRVTPAATREIPSATPAIQLLEPNPKPHTIALPAANPQAPAGIARRKSSGREPDPCPGERAR